MAEHTIPCIFFLFIPLLTCAFATLPFEDCGSAHYLESITVSGCINYPCRLRIGSTANVTTRLLTRDKITDLNSAELDHRVYFVISRIKIAAQVSSNPCGTVQEVINYPSECNLRIGERIACHATLNVRNVPPLPATLFWVIKDKKTGDQLVCYRMSVRLTNV